MVSNAKLNEMWKGVKRSFHCSGPSGLLFTISNCRGVFKVRRWHTCSFSLMWLQSTRLKTNQKKNKGKGLKQSNVKTNPLKKTTEMELIFAITWPYVPFPRQSYLRLYTQHSLAVSPESSTPIIVSTNWSGISIIWLVGIYDYAVAFRVFCDKTFNMSHYTIYFFTALCFSFQTQANWKPKRIRQCTKKHGIDHCPWLVIPKT